MNNLEKIKAMEDSNLKWILWAWAMGWSAILRYKGFEVDLVVVSIIGHRVFVRNEITKQITDELPESMYFERDGKITGYLYAGELGGNEPIPEGQKFRVKATGEIFMYYKYERSPDSVILKKKKNPRVSRDSQHYDKSEIEPIFP